MLRSSLTFLPVALMAQFNPSLVSTHNIQAQPTQYAANYDAATQITQVAAQLAQTSAQVAQISGSFMKQDGFINNANFNQAAQGSALAYQLASQLVTDSAAFNKSSPALTKLAAAAVQNAALLNQQVQKLNASIGNQEYFANCASQIALAASRVAQLAAQTAQEVAFSSSNPTQANFIAQNAESAAQIANLAAQSMLHTSPKMPATQASKLSPSQVMEVKQIVNNTIKSNPDVIINTIAGYHSKPSELQAQALVKARSNDIFSENNQLVLGNPHGDVTIVEFNDYNCNYCKKMSATLLEATKLDPNLKVMIKEAPVINADSTLAAKAAIAAKRQGQYDSFRNMMAKSSSPTNQAFVNKVAKSIGLDHSTFKADLTNPAIDSYLAKNIELARSLGLSSTPTIIISKNNGQFSKMISGAVSLSKLKELVTKVRNINTI